MKTSAFGIKAIARREGTVLHVYLDSKGLPTAGVGHLITASEKAEFPVGKPVTQSQSDRWLAADLKESEDAVNGAVKTPLAQNQFDALVSLTFNIGPGAFERSTVVRKLNAGDTAGAADAILLWNKPPEIRGRRRTEYNQFLTPYKNSAVAPSVNSAISPPIPANQQGGSADSQPPNNQDTTKLEVTQDSVKLETSNAPKGDPPDTAPVKVSKGGPLAHWLFAGGGLASLGTAVWGYVGNHLDAVAVGIICLTVLILAIIFRGAITDAIRMQSASDPDKFNVK